MKRGVNVRNPVRRALDWQAELERDRLTRAELARRKGVSRTRVTQAFKLLEFWTLPLELSQDVQEAVLTMRDPVSAGIVSDRMLRHIVKFPDTKQLLWF